jgi:hypothetical protein
MTTLSISPHIINITTLLPLVIHCKGVVLSLCHFTLMVIVTTVYSDGLRGLNNFIILHLNLN